MRGTSNRQKEYSIRDNNNFWDDRSNQKTNSAFTSPKFNQYSQYKQIRENQIKESAERTRVLSPNPQHYEQFASKYSSRRKEVDENSQEWLKPQVQEPSSYFESKLGSISSTKGTLRQELEDLASTKQSRVPLKDISNTVSLQQYQNIVPSNPEKPQVTRNFKYEAPSYSSDQSSLQTISKISNPPEVLRKLKWEKVIKNVYKI